MIILDHEQGTDEWKSSRLGRPTASNFSNIVTTTGYPSKQQKKYMYKLAGEKVSGNSEDIFQNSAMLRGIELEPEARDFYSIVKGVDVKQVGLCLDDNEQFGASPDGLVGDDGLLEIKCPTMPVHVEYLLNNSLPTAYFQQVQGQMLVTGRKWCDFLSYSSGIRPLLIRVDRDEDFIKKLHIELIVFCKQLDEVINKIK